MRIVRTAIDIEWLWSRVIGPNSELQCDFDETFQFAKARQVSCHPFFIDSGSSTVSFSLYWDASSKAVDFLGAGAFQAILRKSNHSFNKVCFELCLINSCPTAHSLH